MAISTFAELKTSVATWLGNRSDLTALIPDFVTMAEARINYGGEEPYPTDPLRIRSMIANADVTMVAGTASASLPTRFLEGRRGYIDGDAKRPLSFYAPTQFYGTDLTNFSGKPQIYTIEGDSFIFAPVPDSAYTLKVSFWQAFAALSGDSDTNWLLTNAPNVYLYSTLLEASIFTRNDQNVNRYLGLTKSAVNGLNASTARSQFSGAPLVIRADVRVY
jgi:hypothetical protein